MGKMNLEEISRVQFKNLEDINLREAMKAVSTFNQKLSFLSIIKRLVSIIIKNDYDMKRYGLGKVVFVFSNSYSERKTYRIIFEKVMKLFPDRTEILSKKKIHFDWNRLSSLGLFCVWYYQLRKSKMSVFDKLNVCSYLLQGYCDSEAVLKSIQENETALVVTFCDVHMIDYIITKRCNDLGIKTATVQHGVFHRGWCYSYSHSTYFLAQGEHSRQLAIESGLCPENVISVGMMQYIGDNPDTFFPDTLNIRTAGVVLNGPAYKEDNKFLIKCAEYMAEQYHFKYVLRYHPALDKNEYSDLCQREYLADIDGDSGSVQDFANKVDIVLLGNTTVFSEMIWLNKITIRYIEKNDFYEGIDWCKITNLSELDLFVDKLVNHFDDIKQKIIETKNELMPPDDPAVYYRKFFERFGNGN